MKDFRVFLGCQGRGQSWAVSVHSLDMRPLRLWEKRAGNFDPSHSRPGLPQHGREKTDLSFREVLVLLGSRLCRMGQGEGKIFLAFTSLQGKMTKGKGLGGDFQKRNLS